VRYEQVRGYAEACKEKGWTCSLSPDLVLKMCDGLDAANTIHHFLWEEKETYDPGEDLRNQGFAAVEQNKDYDREEELTLRLGAMLDALDGGSRHG
jgi:hypothetical protein